MNFLHRGYECSWVLPIDLGFANRFVDLFYIIENSYEKNIRMERYSIKTLFCIFVDGKRKTRDTGAVPTENLPQKSHETKPTSTRRVLVRQQSGPSSDHTSSPPVEKKETFDEFATHLKEIPLYPWTVASSTDTEIRIVLNDNDHSIPKYALNIDSCLHFF